MKRDTALELWSALVHLSFEKEPYPTERVATVIAAFNEDEAAEGRPHKPLTPEDMMYAP